MIQGIRLTIELLIAVIGVVGILLIWGTVSLTALIWAFILDVSTFFRIIKNKQAEIFFFFDQIPKRGSETFSWASLDFFLPFISRGLVKK